MEAKPNLKEMPPKKRIEYIWEYYKFHIIVTIVLLTAAISLIHHYVTLKDNVLDIMIVNGMTQYEDTAPGINDFFEQEGFDSKKEEITVDTSITYILTEDSYQEDYYTNETLSLRLTVGGVDVFFAPWQVYDAYALSGCMTDLSAVLTEEEMIKYQDLLVYTTDDETKTEYPCGIHLENSKWLADHGYTTEPCTVGITYTSEHKDTALDFLHYILDYE